MANISNITLCNITETTNYDIRRHRCDTVIDREALNKHGINAGYYVIVVILFYGSSVMFLIASYCNRETKKIVEDKQIDSYLKEFQTVKESSSRDNYRNLKQGMIAKLGGMGMLKQEENACVIQAMFRCLSETLLPATAVASLPDHNGWSGDTIFGYRSYLSPLQECVESTITITAGGLNPDVRHASHQPNGMSANIKHSSSPSAGRGQPRIHREFQSRARSYMPSTKIPDKRFHGSLFNGKTRCAREHISSV